MAVSLALLACVLAGAHALPCRCPDAAPAEAVCGSDSLTYASKCALRCARSPDRPDLAVAHKGACGRAGRSVETRDVMQLNECNEACEVAYSECLKKCTSGTCKERCAQDHLLNCNCQCKKFLNTRSSAALLAVLAAPNGRQTQQYAETTSPANVFIDCYNSVIDATTLCAKKCTSDACRQQCSAGWIEMVCKCNESPSTTSTPSSRGPSLESRVLVVVLTSLLGFVVGH